MGCNPYVTQTGLQRTAVFPLHSIAAESGTPSCGCCCATACCHDTHQSHGAEPMCCCNAAGVDTAATNLANTTRRNNTSSVTWLAIPTSQAGIGLHPAGLKTPRASRKSGALFCPSTGEEDGPGFANDSNPIDSSTLSFSLTLSPLSALTCRLAGVALCTTCL